MPLKIGTHSIVGMVGLRLLAACRRLRPMGNRYATEQALIQPVARRRGAWACAHTRPSATRLRCAAG
jgi:hypothetical protein